jgi:hypothetical protein
MAKYETLKEPVFVSGVTERGSKYGGDIFEVSLTGIKSQKTYKTYIDPQNNNYRDWEMIIEVAQRKGVVLSGLKMKDLTDNLVNADSKPKTEYVVSKEELADILAEYWAAQDNFSKLFGDKDEN